jgi:glycosyltransferase involved in cell wall biosynthesis
MNQKIKKKALFIAAATYFARSLQTTIVNSEDLDIDLILDKKLVGSNSNIDYASKYFSGKVKNIFEICLPLDYCYLGKSEDLLFKITTVLKKPFGWMGKYKIHRMIRRGNYDFIYLNELILHPLIDEDECFIIHVRVIFDKSGQGALRSLKKAKGVIFIDHSTFEPFKDVNLKNKIILNNPFQMTRLLNGESNQLKVSVDWKNKTIFSIIGRVVEIKGVSFVIEAFKKAGPDRCLLFIVGPFHDENYLSYCRSLAGDDPRIIFYGSEENIQLIYDISDYIIRGDPFQGIGRTIFEGLYSGCDVIIPGTNPDLLFEYEKFKDKVHFYIPKDVSSLAAQIAGRADRKITERRYYSNVGEYLEKFTEFVAKSCQKN